ncbi:hypothetical protein AV530_011760 [Patagioenas fasciata monilis]|uniref:Uncharacterized protein n=1 Tax=Patagioenas fasciata monilis TaxID=372326 RepID=A0A1V4KLH9_PATFA|nr:hypothetical protein AV530_011760 [Patagioenas fasciata monilis]
MEVGLLVPPKSHHQPNMRNCRKGEGWSWAEPGRDGTWKDVIKKKRTRAASHIVMRRQGSGVEGELLTWSKQACTTFSQQSLC